MSTWYNDNDPFVVQWLRNLISVGHLPEGLVGEQSIVDVKPEDCAATSHFFAGIGGWAYALWLAGWPNDRPVWTGSCPCQPFSVAGRRGGTTDERHLWPEWFRLIKECRPPTIFGEQVASKDGYAWFDIVQADLESLGYACGMVVSPAAGYGAPHIRHRIYFVADARSERRQQDPRGTSGDEETDGRTGRDGGQPNSDYEPSSYGTHGFWADADWLPCTDGKARATQPGLFPLAHGVPSRVGRLRAYGNAIVPPQAAEFVKAYMGFKEQEDE